MSETAKRIRIFQEPTGFFFCSDDGDFLDARGKCYESKAAATEMAVELARQEGCDIEYVTGSGVCHKTAKRLGVTVKS